MDNDIINTLNYTLDCSSQRLRWYIETGNEKYLTDCDMYLRVAHIYMNEITRNKTNETYQSCN